MNDLGDIEVTIFVDVELLSSAASAGTVVDFQLYIGEEELMTNVTEDNTALVPFSVSNNQNTYSGVYPHRAYNYCCTCVTMPTLSNAASLLGPF